MKQLAARRLVYIFLDAYERGTHGLQLEHDVGVVPPVTGEAVHFVQDDVVNVALLLDEGQHLLELAPVRRLGRLASVDEYRDHLGVQAFGFAVTGLALGGQGVAVGIVVAVYLLGSGYAQVDHGSFSALRLSRRESCRWEGRECGTGRSRRHRMLRRWYSSATVL
ncbi:hypothetical protein [Pseudofrankia sp. DC12]|uniref:hypothetical protein n=1 Tax=Pseudofrankia sp. DC12 TaxID=683315 RepID=UPI000695B4F6|nr:hypothetical protein [Pseudofrankia sp. DC12]